MKKLRRILIILSVVLVAIQFIKPARNISAQVSANDISARYPVSAHVQDILAKACYDCHSNNTMYPWYANIQPVAWWLNNHVRDGKRHLDFSEFTGYSVARQYKKLEETIDEVKHGEMPLDSYTWIHKNAILSETEKDSLYAWAQQVRDTIKARYPADSLVLPKRK